MAVNSGSPNRPRTKVRPGGCEPGPSVRDRDVSPQPRRSWSQCCVVGNEICLGDDTVPSPQLNHREASQCSGIKHKNILNILNISIKNPRWEFVPTASPRSGRAWPLLRLLEVLEAKGLVRRRRRRRRSHLGSTLQTGLHGVISHI